MAINLLKQIAGSRLPMTLYRSEDIDKVRLLRAAGLVVALVPSPADTSSRHPSAAQVVAITQKGSEELAHFDYPRRTARALERAAQDTGLTRPR